jgi:polyisoprenyl-phosphate glycosyltransferase
MNEASTPPNSPTVLSVVVPCHNEALNLEDLVARVRRAFPIGQIEFDFVLVDDGSSDTTLDTMRSLAGHDVSYISLSRNFGKEAAMLAGLQRARGSLVVLMDGDLQHPPELLPNLVQHQLNTGADQVVAQRNREGDPFFRRTMSRLYFKLVNRFMDVRLVDGAGDFRLLSRRAVDALLQLSERTRFSKGFFAWIGYPTATVEYLNEARADGKSSWTLRSLFDHGVDGVLSFNTRPLRSMVATGMVATGFFLAYLVWLVVSAAVSGIVTPGYITLVAIVVFMGGLQLLCIGVLGEYVGRIYLESKARPHYLVGEESHPAPGDQSSRKTE